MSYLLDTNTVSDYIKGVPSVVDRIHAESPAVLATSSITVMELRYGVERRKSEQLKTLVDRFLREVPTISFSDAHAHVAGHLRASLEKQGVTISLADCQIVSIALGENLILVSADKVFSHVPKLSLENWRG